jgi:hypothetical protein
MLNEFLEDQAKEFEKSFDEIVELFQSVNCDQGSLLNLLRSKTY